MKREMKFLIIIIVLILIIFLFMYYKKIKNGNNINKSISDFKEHILNISSYEAKIEVEIFSNKNINKYKIKQWYVKPDIFKQEIQAPENIQGLITIYDGKKFKIENSRLGLSKIYENYNCLINNNLGLNSFIDECIDGEVEEIIQDNEVILKLVSKNKYSKYKNLTINKFNGLPVKMEIMDENKKTLVYILYNEITINSTAKEDVI